MVVVLQYNILKIFTTHFNKIHQIYFIQIYFIVVLLMNERNLH